MLVREDQMQEGEGWLVLGPSRGLAGQLCGALHRLGHRIVGLRTAEESAQVLSEDADLKLPLSFVEGDASRPEALPLTPGSFRAFVAAPHPALSQNRALPADEIEALRKLLVTLQAKNPGYLAFLALPASQPLRDCEALRRAHPAMTIFMLPPIFGLGDEGLFAATYALLHERPASLVREMSSTELEALSLSDAAALLATALSNKSAQGRLFRVPGIRFSLETWRKTFAQSFDAERVSPWKLLKEKLHSAHPLEAWADATPRVPALDTLQSAWEAFPALPTSLARSLGRYSHLLARNPEEKLVFPPGRAL